MTLDSLKNRTHNALRELSEIKSQRANAEVAELTIMLATTNSAISTIETHIQSPALRPNPFPSNETLENIDFFISKAESFIQQQKEGWE